MATQQPLDIHQQELVNVIKAAHQTLAVARKLKTAELSRRIKADELRIRQQYERDLAESSERNRLELDAEVERHASALDEALIVAYNEGVPIRRIALEGFGNRYDGGVQQLMVKLRNDGRLGNRVGWQRNTADPDTIESSVAFPKVVDVESVLKESTTVREPIFTRNAEDLMVSEGIPDRHDEFPPIVLPAVTLTMDRRDPFFKSIAKDEKRGGSKFHDATTVTLYEDFKGNLITHESREENRYYWEHPIARWVKMHPEEARAGFDAAMAAATTAAE